MKARFFELAERLGRVLKSPEMLLCEFSGERSDFVRFNRGKVRQAGSVEQSYVSLRLIRERRQASATLALGGEDFDACRMALDQLRGVLEDLPEDPWLLVNEAPRSTAAERRGTLMPADAVAQYVVGKAQGQDLVGIYAAGTLCRGFANSLGQRNWHEVDSFNFDWSLYLEGDKAVKTGYAGFEWSEETFAGKLYAAADQLTHLRKPRRTIEPGEYRVYLAPRALEEVTGLLSWGGFSSRARATKQSPLLRMESGSTLSRKVTIIENTAEGMAPGFQGEGFVKPPRVTLIEEGRLRDALVSPRSAREYGLAPNAGRESPEAMELSPGDLESRQILDALDTGLYVSNLWYLNFSDRPAGRITGMTRFATFWVEHGRIVAPVTPMRFDDSIYRMLGENLIELTRERELLPDVSTYGERSTSSSHLPGALISSLKFTL
ncbi:MAG: TldD/PmbA family protein [Burkholderiales bacterium]